MPRPSRRSSTVPPLAIYSSRMASRRDHSSAGSYFPWILLAAAIFVLPAIEWPKRVMATQKPRPTATARREQAPAGNPRLDAPESEPTIVDRTPVAVEAAPAPVAVVRPAPAPPVVAKAAEPVKPTQEPKVTPTAHRTPTPAVRSRAASPKAPPVAVAQAAPAPKVAKAAAKIVKAGPAMPTVKERLVATRSTTKRAHKERLASAEVAKKRSHKVAKAQSSNATQRAAAVRSKRTHAEKVRKDPVANPTPARTAVNVPSPTPSPAPSRHVNHRML